MKDELIIYVGQVCKEIRTGLYPIVSLDEMAKNSDGTYAENSTTGLRPNTLDRLERGDYKKLWPRNPDYLIKLYADLIGISPAEIWQRAILRKFAPKEPQEALDFGKSLVEQATTVRPARRRSRSKRRRRSG